MYGRDGTTFSDWEWINTEPMRFYDDRGEFLSNSRTFVFCSILNRRTNMIPVIILLSIIMFLFVSATNQIEVFCDNDWRQSYQFSLIDLVRKISKYQWDFDLNKWIKHCPSPIQKRWRSLLFKNSNDVRTNRHRSMRIVMIIRKKMYFFVFNRVDMSHKMWEKDKTSQQKSMALD